MGSFKSPMDSARVMASEIPGAEQAMAAEVTEAEVFALYAEYLAEMALLRVETPHPRIAFLAPRERAERCRAEDRQAMHFYSECNMR
jgi:hypothetical protein